MSNVTTLNISSDGLTLPIQRLLLQ